MTAHDCDKAGCQLQRIVLKQSKGEAVPTVVGYIGSKCRYEAFDLDVVEIVNA